MKKEHDNKDIKSMWRNLGAYLDEQNAERTAGTLGAIQLVQHSVDRDCFEEKRLKKRKLLTKSLLTCCVMKPFQGHLVERVMHLFPSSNEASYMVLTTGICTSG